MGDFGRVAHATLRSTSFLRHTPIRSAFSASVLRPTAPTASVSFANQRHNSSWAKPTRLTRENPDGIKKPSSTSYNYAYGDRNNKDGVEYASSVLEDMELGLSLSPNELKPNVDSVPISQALPRPPLRLAARTGRTIHVSANGDIARSIRMLQSQCARNDVLGMLRRQKYHERPGLKRKRLKSQRWVKKFRAGFNAAVTRVKELREQGW